MSDQPVLTFNNGKFILSIPWGSDNFMPHGNYDLDLRTAVPYQEYADEKAKKVFERVLIKYYPEVEVPQVLINCLDLHQIEGIKWVLTRSRSYLAHPPGAGKTAEAIVAFILSGVITPMLVIVPPDLTTNWAREIIKWTEWIGVWPTIAIVHTSNKRDEMDWTADFIICPDSMLTKEWVHTNLTRLDSQFIAIDEASRFKEITSQRSKVFYGGIINDKKYFGLYQRAKHVVFLDGSPMLRGPSDLWGPTYALNPEAIGCLNQFEFGMRYCGPTINERGEYEFKHSSNEEELKEKLQRHFMHVVSEESLKHPERRRSILLMNQDPRTAEMKSFERKHLSQLKLNEIDEAQSQGAIATYRRELGISKVKWAASYIGRLLEKGEKLLVFCWHRDVAIALEKSLINFEPLLIIGGTSTEKRDWFCKKFQNAEHDLMICNIGAMSRGRNLQRATRVVFVEYSWIDQANVQAEKRTSRKGNDNEFIRADYLVIPNSLDEIVLQAVFRREKQQKKVIGI